MPEIIMPSAYPDAKPWVDVAHFLEPGLSKRFDLSCSAQADGNNVNLNVRLTVGADHVDRVSNARYMLMTLQAPFSAGGSFVVTGLADNVPVPIGIDSSGRLGIMTAAGVRPSECRYIDFSATIWRK